MDDFDEFGDLDDENDENMMFDENYDAEPDLDGEADISNVKEHPSKAIKSAKPPKGKAPKEGKAPVKREPAEEEPEFKQIPDEPFEDLSAYYNKEDIGVLEDDGETKSAKKAKGKANSGTGKKKAKPLVVVAIILGSLLLIGGGIFAAYKIIENNNKYNTLYEPGEKFNNGTIEVEVTEAAIVDSLLTYQMDEDYVYIAVVYNFTNKTTSTLDWSCTPYLSLKPYDSSEKGYVPISDEKEQSLISQIIHNNKEDEPGADTPAIDMPTGPEDVAEGDSQGVLTGEDYDNQVQAVTEDSGDDTVDGVFDFNALQIFALDRGIDFSSVKDDLAPNETRQSADVFKVRKELFDNSVYFIGFDNLKAVVKISLEPVVVNDDGTVVTDSQGDPNADPNAPQ